MKLKTLVTCGQESCKYNYDGYCQRKNIHVNSKDKSCDVFHNRESEKKGAAK